MTLKTCRQCNKQLPNTREYFHRYKDNTGKERLLDICKSCVRENRLKEEWKDGLLLCHVCGNYLPIELFDISSNNKLRDGRDRRCKACKLKLNRITKQKYSIEQKLHHILLSRLLGAKLRSQKHGIEFNIDLQYLYDLYNKQEGKCAITGIPMTYDVLSGRTFTNISVDKIDPNKGYVKGNVQLVCMVVNLMKSNLSYDELLFYCLKIIEGLKKK